MPAAVKTADAALMEVDPDHRQRPQTAATRRFAGRLDLKQGAVDMSHGSGGRAMAQLIDELFRVHLDNAVSAGQ
jgi:hypothetical protein